MTEAVVFVALALAVVTLGIVVERRSRQLPALPARWDGTDQAHRVYGLAIQDRIDILKQVRSVNRAAYVAGQDIAKALIPQMMSAGETIRRFSDNIPVPVPDPPTRWERLTFWVSETRIAIGWMVKDARGWVRDHRAEVRFMLVLAAWVAVSIGIAVATGHT